MRIFLPRVSKPTAQTVPNVKSERPDVNELARQVTELQRERAQNPFTYGTQLDFQIDDLALTVRLLHRLGRVPRGWIVLDVVSSIADSPLCRLDWDASSITLYSARECHGRVLVY